MAGLVTARIRVHRALLAAAFLTVLLTTSVLAALTAYAGALGDASLRHALGDPAAAAETSLLVRADIGRDGRATADAAVRRAAGETFDGLPVTVRPLIRSGSYALPAAGDGDGAKAREAAGDPDLTHFAALDPAEVRFTSGRAPARDAALGSAPVETALAENAARAMGLSPGDRLTLTDRLGGPSVPVVITGLYRPRDADAPYWRLDELGGRGAATVDFTTYGPLLTDPAVLTSERVSTGPSSWLVSADFASLTTDRLDSLRSASRDGAAALTRSGALGQPEGMGGTTASAVTGLPAALDRIERSLEVSRSTLLTVAAQLAVPAGCALLLTARLLTAERSGETRLLLARGASRRRLSVLAGAEALLLTLPAAFFGPLLALPLTALMGGQGDLARIGLRPDTSLAALAGRPDVWLASAVTALACAAAMTLPALTGAATAGGGRARALPGPLRAGGDLALVALAVVAYLQLRRESDGASGLGLDPLLIAAPATALLAGTVLTLRLLPPLARLAERLATRGRGAATALAAWQIARRPGRATAPVLLLAPAVALGMLAIGQHASSQRSQDDRADFRAGAQIRVTAPSAAGPGTAETFAAVEGVRSVAPAARTALPMSGDRTATVLALNTREASATLRMRPDLSDGSAAARVAALAPRSAPAGPVVPEGSTGLRMTARLADATGSRAASPAEARPPRRGAEVTVAEATAVLTDAHGTVFRLPLGELPADTRPHTLTAGLSGGGAPGGLTLTGVELVVTQPPSGARRHLLAVEAVHAVDPAGNDRPLDLAADWRASAVVEAADVPGGAAPARPKVLAAGPPVVEYGTGQAPSGISWPTMKLRLTVDQQVPEAVPGLATDRFLESSGARVGETLDVALGSATVPVRLTGAVRALPTTGEGVEEGRTGGALLLDLGAVNRSLQDLDGSSLTPGEWWLDTAAGEAAGAAAGLRARPELRAGQVLVRDEVAAGLRGDPFGVGPAAALTAAAAAAVVLATVGFAVAAVGSLRERRADLAVLRALGAPRRRLGRAVAAEQAVLVGLALAAGTALGMLLSRAVVPLTLVTSEATRPVPEPLVSLPPGPVALLLAAVAAVPLLTTALLSRRRPSASAALRDEGGH
ncbi:FtsX-like permease family protein [Streptomyces abyssomicinicus]|uniref:FtsX-like permease family protein n=1 Tax=Streptomyces abyssomicinicus TaxID=574929 RepID=UPI0013DFCAF4|nr:FtsX-like permease family protein [Streptomyces abyssomicinicus]